jgi:hypothetical protein
VVQRAERSPQYCLGPMWTMYSSLRATLGLRNEFSTPSSMIVHSCTLAR